MYSWAAKIEVLEEVVVSIMVLFVKCKKAEFELELVVSNNKQIG